MTVAILSDTHIPSRATEIPESFRRRISQADLTIHAGDFTSEAAFETVRRLADGDLTAVAGNMDQGELNLPLVETVKVDGVTFVVTHGTGDLEHYRERVAAIVREEGGTDAVGIAGHSHEVLDETVEGLRLLNPGSATGAAPADANTMMTAEVEGSRLDVQLHEL